MNMLLTVPTLAIALLVISPAAATAGSRCEEVLAGMGRTFVPDASSSVSLPGAHMEIFDCPADQLTQFVYDVAAVRAATDVTSAEQLIGTWVSDDVLGIYAGIYIPVYEVLEISPGTVEGEIEIVQRLFRATDLVKWFASAHNPIPPVEVVPAGRIATYGEHVAAIGQPGQLEPREMRYHDFPVDGDRSVGLAMKARMMSFQQIRPIGIRTDGNRLVFAVPDRMATNGQRIMTFRKRRSGLPEIALLIVLLGEQSMAKFPCFLEAVDTRTPAFERALGKHSEAAFFTALRERYQWSSELEALRAKLNKDLPEAERSVLKTQLLAHIGGSQIDEDDPLMILARETGGDAPFGCPEIY